jgi:hypothetical protein
MTHMSLTENVRAFKGSSWCEGLGCVRNFSMKAP